MGVRQRLTATRRRWSAYGARAPQREFFRLLARAGENLQRTAELMHEMLATWPEDRGFAAEITECEHEGDRITRTIVHGLHRSRMAPIDRNDIYALASAVDDVVDDIEEGAQDLVMYRIEAPMEQAQKLAGVLRDSGRALARALAALQSLEGMEDDLQQIRRLEQEGDRIYRESLAALFDGGIDPMIVIRWKDVFGILEEAIDRCRSAANILQSIVVKHA
jgi:predicted phosphate transport protein (TIGR00153 family)